MGEQQHRVSKGSDHWQINLGNERERADVELNQPAGRMGNCIGEGNHAYFWWFLFSETALTGWGLYQVIRTVQYYDDLHESMSRNGFAIATGTQQ